MTTEQTPNPEPTDEEKDPKWYRETLAREKERIAEKDQEITVLKAQQMQMVVEQLGLDITQGPGKAVADFYKGEPDATQVATFAKEYGWQPPETPDSGPATIIREAQQRVTAATQGGAPLTAPTELDEIQAAERAGDWPLAIRLKLDAHSAGRVQQSG